MCVPTYVPAGDNFITIEEECLEGAIKFDAIELTSSIPEGFLLEFVSFDVYCNTSEGVQLEVRMIGLLMSRIFASNFVSTQLLVINA